ncbi:MAG: YraN family protein [Planctomycetota bacterium]
MSFRHSPDSNHSSATPPLPSSTQQHRARSGRRAEFIAAMYLRLKGYRIVERNLRTPLAEIDILAQQGSTLVVCEVKSRRGAGEVLIAADQRRRLARAAHWVARRSRRFGFTVRIDLVAVEFARRFPHWPRVRHYPAGVGVESDRDAAR